MYRALKFLRSHKLERLNAFVGCPENHAHHAAQFLICVTCGGVTELEDDGISRAVGMAAAQTEFRTRQVMVEGVCGGAVGEALWRRFAAWQGS